METLRPLVCTYRELAGALAPLHGGDAGLLAGLHDIWLEGAPTPDSIIRNPRGYDPRLYQPGNVERRLVLPNKLAAWVQQASAQRGMPLAARQAYNLIAGHADYGVDLHNQPLLISLPGGASHGRGR